MNLNDEITIIGGGSSARRVDLAALPGTIIGVNDAALHAPRVDVVVSMDRAWIENRVAALDHMKLPSFLRLSALRNVFDLIREPWVFPFDCRNETGIFGKFECMLNGPSSGHCAMNLAFIRWPRRINLVGFDSGSGGHWFPTYSWAKPMKVKSDWSAALGEGIRQCEGAGIEVVHLGRG